MVNIGEFSRLSHIGTKTLRYYHDVGLLVPAAVDAGTGYRWYSTAQVTPAHLIRRLRELDMPIAGIRDVLAAADSRSRDEVLAGHLRHLEGELERTQRVIASLRAMLEDPRKVQVEHRQAAALPVLTFSGHVTRAGMLSWFPEAFGALYAEFARAGIDPAGAAGAAFPMAFFAEDEGEIMAFVPVPPGMPAPEADRMRLAVLAPQRFAIAVHAGAFGDFDRTYGALGSHVAGHDTSLNEPVREIYLVGPDHTADPGQYRTEVCWPIASQGS